MTESTTNTGATVTAGPVTLALEGATGPFSPSLSSREVSPGVWEVCLRLTSDEPSAVVPVRLVWKQPLVDIHATWHPGRGMDRALKPNFSAASWLTAKATSQAPVICLHSQSGNNRLTFAVDDALHPIHLQAGVEEETAQVCCAMAVPEASQAPGAAFAWTLRLDTRPIPWHRALAEVADWWANRPDYTPAVVPDTGRLPMYSTWYSMHQQVEPAAVETQCRLARDIGCHAVIVDDGWQTLDNRRGYAYCGDWQPERIDDMADHVRRVHETGLKYLLWYAVPFVGVHSAAYERLKDKCLRVDSRKGAGVLDPRYPEVRDYLIGTYETAMQRWNLDGFKLDFVDSFRAGPETSTGAVDGRDIAGIDDAADRLLTDVITRLRRINPDVLIEFRQSYIGPLMRKYGNLFRAGDCPGDMLSNRVRTMDIRAICGRTAAHADMLMWHPQDSVQSAALQLLNVLFTVPQISVPLDAIPEDHLTMLRFWLGFWQTHRDCLLDGELEPHHPESLYPLVVARTDRKTIAAAYGAAGVTLDRPTETLYLVNATPQDHLVLDLTEPWGQRSLTVQNTTGRQVHESAVSLDPGVHRIAVPPSGLATLRTTDA